MPIGDDRHDEADEDDDVEEQQRIRETRAFLLLPKGTCEGDRSLFRLTCRSQNTPIGRKTDPSPRRSVNAYPVDYRPPGGRCKAGASGPRSEALRRVGRRRPRASSAVFLVDDVDGQAGGQQQRAVGGSGLRSSI